MLIEFSCKNYKSISEKITLSMLATKDTSFEESLHVVNDKIKLLPAVSIYGSNGAGKTNIINGIGFLSFLVGKSIELFQEGDRLPFFPHKLSENDKPSTFQIQFITKGNRYAYGFSANEEEIIEEYLYYFPKGKQAKIYERTNEEYSIGAPFSKELGEIKNKKTKKNRLFISTAASWTNAEEILEPFTFMKDSLVVNQSLGNSDWLHFTLTEIEKNLNTKKLLTNILKDLNVGISDIEAKINYKKLVYDELPSELPEEIKMLLTKKDAINPEVGIFYDKMRMDLNEESRGIQKMFEIGGPIIDILSKGEVLIYDELETSLHPLLVLHLIKLFQDPEINKYNAQIIFTTHDTNLLDLELMRRDQIWLVEKNLQNYATDLYSLSDIKNVRKDENIEKGYIKGKYGAIPFIGNRFIREWINHE